MKTAPVLSAEEVTREDVAFPKLDAAEMEAVKQDGRAQTFEAGEVLYKGGDRPLDCFVVVSGQLAILDATGDGERLLFHYGAGDFTGEVTVLTGHASALGCRACVRSEVIRLTQPVMRRLLIKCPTLGEKWLPALIRRRNLAEKLGVDGLRVFGARTDLATHRVRDFLHRNGIINRWFDTSDAAVAKLAASLGPAPLEFPLVVCSRNILRQNPSLTLLAEHLGVERQIPDEIFDTIIIGSGPSGLGAAVYAASEGLRTLILDSVGPGGQAGSSARIENYAGFPTGLSGHELALRAYLQALKFGAIFSAPQTVSAIKRTEDGFHEVRTGDGVAVRAKTVIISTGVTYRKLGAPGLAELHGTGVYYAATQIEATLCENQPIHIIGAGNSAGQAAMYLSKFSKDVSLIVRGGGLAKTMSSYLSERVLANPRVRLRLHTELRGVEGEFCIDNVRLENTATGEKTIEKTGGVFIFIGATPCTDFVGDEIARDEMGYIVTGTYVAPTGKWPLQERQPLPLESSSPGVFVSGDCRSRTTKRVAFAVGDGALAVTCVHELLGTYS